MTTATDRTATRRHPRRSRAERPAPASTSQHPDPSAAIRADVLNWFHTMDRAFEAMLTRVHEDARIRRAFSDHELQNIKEAAQGALESIIEAFANPLPVGFDPLPLFPSD